MAAILLPSRWTQQPQQIAGIADEFEPYARYVLVGGQRNNLVKPSVAVDAKASLTATPLGVGWKTASGSENGAILGAPEDVFKAGQGFTLLLAAPKMLTNDGHGFCGIDVSGANTSAAQLYLPFVDGTLYWRWGGSTEGATQLTISGLTYRDTDVFAVTTGARGMEIWQNGSLRASNTANPSRSAGGGTVAALGTITDAAADSVQVAMFASLDYQPTRDRLSDLTQNPWQIFRPLVRRIYFDLGAGGTTYNQSLTANASGSAAFARAVQAIKSASATSSAITERLIAIQRSATSTAAATATKQTQLSRSASGMGTATLTSIKTVLQAVTASAIGSPALSRMVGMLRSVSSTSSATYSRTVGLLRSVTGTGTATLTGPAAPQFLRPDGNVTQTSFTGGFAEIDEAIASDADFAYGTNNTAAVLEVSLSNPTGTPASGTTTVRYRIAKTNAGTVDGGGNAVTVTAAVYQGTTLIASDAAQTATGTWTQYSWAPSMASVTDWNDLRLRFTTSASGGTAANRRGGAVSWAEVEAPAAGATTFNQALTATSTAAASFLRSIGRAASASASGAASLARSFGKLVSASASGAASYLRSVLLARGANSTGSATLNAARAFLKELTANSTGAATLATAVAVAMTLSAAATGSALLVASVGLLIVASAIGTASASRVIGLVRAATSTAAAAAQRGITMALSVVSSVVAALTKFASTAGTSLARMLSINAESRIRTPNAENRIRTMDAEDRDLAP